MKVHKVCQANQVENKILIDFISSMSFWLFASHLIIDASCAVNYNTVQKLYILLLVFDYETNRVIK